MMGAVAVAWFRKSDWPRWLEIDSDFQRDYDHWEANAESQLGALEDQGISVTKVVLDPDSFLAWCRENDCEPFRDSRARYAAASAAEQDKGCRIEF